MTKRLETSLSIRQELGRNLETIHDWSAIGKERSKTAQLRKKLIDRYPPFCAACGDTFEQNNILQAAHVLALAEGGSTDLNNLVGLCEGCHKDYDVGYASFAEMTRAAEAWRKGRLYDPVNNLEIHWSTTNSTKFQQKSVGLSPLMDERKNFRASPIFRPSHVPGLGEIYRLISIRNFRKALNKVIHAKSSNSQSRAAQAMLTILGGQIERRRSAAGCIANARRLISALELDQIPLYLLPLYYYERGYLSQMMGQHNESIHDFEMSAQSSRLLDDEYTAQEIAVATLRKCAVETIKLPLEELPKSEVSERCREFDSLIESARGFPSPWSGRWTQNIAGWKWRYCYKCGDFEQASSAYSQMRMHRNKSDITNGYFRETESRACSYQAMMLLKDPSKHRQLSLAIRLASRAIVSTIGFRTPLEGIRDLLFVLEQALVSSEKESFLTIISNLSQTRQSVVDGSSFLDPFRM